MKKRILMSLVATFIIAVSAFAQTNTYNMVLTLADGTVITIGPNDLKQLDFKEGDVTVSGTNITTLMSSITAMQAQIEALKADLAATESKVSSVDIGIMENKYDIEAAKAQIARNTNDINTVAASLQANKEELQQAIAMVKAEEDVKIDKAVDDMSKMKEDSDMRIAELTELVSILEQRIKQLEEAE